MQRPFRVGRSCDAWCTRCRSITEHTVIAMVGNLPKRVQCGDCGGQHNYRDPASRSQAGRRKSSSTTRRRKPASPLRWQSRLAEQSKNGNDAQPYSTAGTFAEGDVVDHSGFGLGIVEKVLPGDKIEVLFEAGTRLLAHNRS